MPVMPFMCMSLRGEGNGKNFYYHLGCVILYESGPMPKVTITGCLHIFSHVNANLLEHIGKL